MNQDPKSDSRPSTNRIPKTVNRPQLSLTTAYNLRRLLTRNLDCLTWSEKDKSSPPVDPFTNLEGLLAILYPDEPDLIATIKRLEHLVSYHTALSNQAVQNRVTLQETEQAIFWLLGFKYKETPHKGLVLIVDDQPENLRLLSTTLTKQRYEVRNAASGSMALTAAQTAKPDLVLLDIMMPGMDGYEVCRQLKANPQTQEIPVVFVSAIDDVFDKVKAFEVGGVDYITKPFQIDEVLIRVAHHLKIRDLQQRLEQQNARLQSEMATHHGHQQSLKLSKVALDQMGDYVVFVNSYAQVMQINEAACEVLDYEWSELMTKKLQDFDVTWDANVWSATWQKISQWGFATWQAQHCQRTGLPFSVSIAATYCRLEQQDYACLVVSKILKP